MHSTLPRLVAHRSLRRARSPSRSLDCWRVITSLTQWAWYVGEVVLVAAKPRHSWWSTRVPATQEAVVRERQDRDSYAYEGRLFVMEGPMGPVQRLLRTSWHH